MRNTRHYQTVREARNALALDTGFDPFVVNHERCTKDALACYGYPVDAVIARKEEERRSSKLLTREQADRLLRPVGQCTNAHQWAVDTYGNDCPACGEPAMYDCQCDSGHRWRAAANSPESQRCPKCGEYAV